MRFSKILKAVILLLLSLTISFSFAGCGDSTPKTPKERIAAAIKDSNGLMSEIDKKYKGRINDKNIESYLRDLARAEYTLSAQLSNPKNKEFLDQWQLDAERVKLNATLSILNNNPFTEMDKIEKDVKSSSEKYDKKYKSLDDGVNTYIGKRNAALQVAGRYYGKGEDAGEDSFKWFVAELGRLNHWDTNINFDKVDVSPLVEKIREHY